MPTDLSHINRHTKVNKIEKILNQITLNTYDYVIKIINPWNFRVSRGIFWSRIS